jgi:FixJ family two-component response regulator
MCPDFRERKQYQSRMDAANGMVHCDVMQSRKSADEPPLLSVVDDDEMLRESLPDLLRECGFAARAFSSGKEFLSSEYVEETRCLILDIAMAGMSGLELQQELKRRKKTIPIIFITAHRDEGIRQQALGQGAVTVLYKPFSDTALLDAVSSALRLK